MSVLRPFKALDMFKFNNMYVSLLELYFSIEMVQKFGYMDRDSLSTLILLDCSQ